MERQWNWVQHPGAGFAPRVDLGFAPRDVSRDKLLLRAGFSPRCAFAPCGGMNLHPGMGLHPEMSLHPGMNSHPGMGLYPGVGLCLRMGSFPGEGFTQLWICTLQWDEFASRGVFAPQLEGMEEMSGTRRPPGRGALRSCLEPVPAAGCPTGAVSSTGHGAAVPV